MASGKSRRGAASARILALGLVQALLLGGCAGGLDKLKGLTELVLPKPAAPKGAADGMVPAARDAAAGKAGAAAKNAPPAKGGALPKGVPAPGKKPDPKAGPGPDPDGKTLSADIAGPGAQNVKPVLAPLRRAPPPAAELPAAGKVAVWLTSGDRAALLLRQPDLALGSLPRALTPWSQGVETAGPLPAPGLAITIDAAQRRQQLSGFGAALSASSAALLKDRMSAGQRQTLLAELFGPPPGIGLSVARLYLGASEFAASQYSYDDLPPDAADPGLAQFSIDVDRAAVLPLVRDALALNPELVLIASPTSAPGWMKTGGSLLQGTLKPDAFDAYARYLKRYADLYLEEGVPIHAITLQNEPLAEAADMPGMRLDEAARTQLIGKHLGPLLEQEGPLILEWDGNWDGAKSPLKVLADPLAAQYVAGVAWHCYAGDVAAQGALADAHPGLESYITECSGGAWAPAWRDNLTHFARTLVLGATRGAANGIMLGNLALDERGGPRIGGCRGCRGVVTVGTDGAVTRNAEYYALAHASRHVRPGAWRVHASPGRDGVDAAAFDNGDGTLVLVAVNSAADARTFAVRAGGGGFSATLPAASVATYIWRSEP